MHFKAVDLSKNLQLCLDFRRDTHLLSYGTLDGFDTDECIRWFMLLKESYPSGFEHIIQDNQIIGQLEYRSGIQQGEQIVGYINLFYLLPEYRKKGYGYEMQQYVFSKFIADGCACAFLRYLPKNMIAGKFYSKNGWQPVGIPNERGQLMRASI